VIYIYIYIYKFIYDNYSFEKVYIYFIYFINFLLVLLHKFDIINMHSSYKKNSYGNGLNKRKDFGISKTTQQTNYEEWWTALQKA